MKDTQPQSVSSVTQSCLTLCDPTDCSTPGLPVHHQLSEFTQTHAHWVSDDIQPSHPLSSPSPPTFNLSQHQGLFPKSQFFPSGGQSIRVWAWASVLPVNIQDWFPLGWTGWISLSTRDSWESSPTPQFKSINSLVLNSLYSPTLTSIHDYWKNHTFDYIDLCWQSLVSVLSRFVIAFLPRTKPEDREIEMKRRFFFWRLGFSLT